MLRLTHAQYLSTLADLYPMLDLGALRLPADPLAGYYDSNVAALETSPTLVADQHDGARLVSAALVPHLAELSPCATRGDRACLVTLIEREGRRLFRRPVTAAESAALAELFDSGPSAGDFAVSARLALQVLLESPDFLYRSELGTAATPPQLTARERATRLAALLWASGPDDALLDAAEGGRLDTDADIAAQVDRMVADDKMRRGFLHFADQWLALDRLTLAGKLPAENFDAVRPSLVESLQRFVWGVFVSGGTQSDLFRSARAWVDAGTAPLFGVTLPAGPATWMEVETNPRERAGILTHPAILAGHGYPDYPSPVLRGVFVLERFLCAPPAPPPAGITQSPPATSDGGRILSNREGYDRVTTQAGTQCAACHEVINPLGFALESYDTMGRYRALDAGRPVDSAGTSMGFAFTGGVDLAGQLATSDRVSRCIVQHWVEYATADTALAGDPCFRRDLEASFAASGYQLRALVRAIALHPKFAQAAVVEE